jgi:hypothetical protein
MAAERRPATGSDPHTLTSKPSSIYEAICPPWMHWFFGGVSMRVILTSSGGMPCPLGYVPAPVERPLCLDRAPGEAPAYHKSGEMTLTAYCGRIQTSAHGTTLT